MEIAGIRASTGRKTLVSASPTEAAPSLLSDLSSDPAYCLHRRFRMPTTRPWGRPCTCSSAEAASAPEDFS
eukprot:scaffold3581_cov252-Pinguiococcus_pyrenoidosus.AAC.5